MPCDTPRRRRDPRRVSEWASVLLWGAAVALGAGCGATARTATANDAGTDAATATTEPADARVGGSGGSPAAGGGGTAGGAGAGGMQETAGATGTAAGGRTGAGGGGTPLTASFFIGADLTQVQQDEAAGATYSDGSVRDILALMKGHGFNYVRLRTFFDPRAADGYSPQGFDDLVHTIAFALRVKAAGMGFLLDLHYSDNWADPGKQCIPIAWQGMNIAQMSQAVHDYTFNSVKALADAGARPDMVQVGNEITPGMLIHVCNGAGTPTSIHPVNGIASTANWPNLGSLLKAGVKGVKDVDASIQIMLHIDRGGDTPTATQGAALATSQDWIRNAMAQGVPFDVFGESCYVAYQGDAASWRNTFTTLAAAYPNLKFVIAEYGPMERQANDVIFNLPNRQGLGTFFWEPTRRGVWGPGLFTVAGNLWTATADLALFDAMKVAYAGRLQP